MKKSTEPCQKLHPPSPQLFHLCAFPPLPKIIYQAYSDNETDSDYVAYQVKQEYANIYMLQEGHSEL